MVRSAPPSTTLPSTYNDFLYAPVGEDKNGALLTVLSMLARNNVDPWEEAADLSRLPRDIAMRKLISMITVSLGQPSTLADQTAADRLIALLPSRAATAGTTHNAPPGAPSVDRPPALAKLVLVAVYIGLMFLGQWMAASAFDRARVDGAASSTPALPSTLGQTLPSTTADNGANKSPQ